jgi:hypothetical protein
MNFLFPTRLQIFYLVNISSHMVFVVRHECLQLNRFEYIHDCKKEASIYVEVGQKVFLNGKQLPKQD